MALGAVPPAGRALARCARAGASFVCTTAASLPPPTAPNRLPTRRLRPQRPDAGDAAADAGEVPAIAPDLAPDVAPDATDDVRARPRARRGPRRDRRSRRRDRCGPDDAIAAMDADDATAPMDAPDVAPTDARRSLRDAPDAPPPTAPTLAVRAPVGTITMPAPRVAEATIVRRERAQRLDVPPRHRRP